MCVSGVSQKYGQFVHRIWSSSFLTSFLIGTSFLRLFPTFQLFQLSQTLSPGTEDNNWDSPSNKKPYKWEVDSVPFLFFFFFSFFLFFFFFYKRINSSPVYIFLWCSLFTFRQLFFLLGPEFTVITYRRASPIGSTQLPLEAESLIFFTNVC